MIKYLQLQRIFNTAMATEFLNHHRSVPPEIYPSMWEEQKLDILLKHTSKLFNIHTHSFPEITIDEHNRQPIQVKERVVTQNNKLQKLNIFSDYSYFNYPHPMDIAAKAGYMLGYQSSNFPMVIATHNRDKELSMLKFKGRSITDPSSWVSFTYLCGHPDYKDLGRKICKSLAQGKLPSNFMFDLAFRTFHQENGQLDISTKNTSCLWPDNNFLTIVGCEFTINDKQKTIIIDSTATCITQPLPPQK